MVCYGKKLWYYSESLKKNYGTLKKKNETLKRV